MSNIILLTQNFYQLFIDSAPWLLLGLLIAGMIKAFVPSALMAKHLGNNDTLSVFKAAIFGAPLPLCSCGVIPAALGLHRSGASKAATTSFLIATPETGVDSIGISYALLGPYIAIIRPIAAIITAISAGILVLFFGKDDDKNKTHEHTNTQKCKTNSNSVNDNPLVPDSHNNNHNQNGCCANTVVTEEPKEDSCCAKTDNPPSSIYKRMQQGLRFTAIDLIKDITGWLLLGLLAAAIIMTMIPDSFLAKWGNSFYAFVVMAVIGIPMYICATASTPVAAGLLFAGVSPGAVLVFLLVGPATNFATMAMVKKELGTTILSIYLSTVVLMGFTFGYLTNMLMTFLQVDFIQQASHVHALNPLVSQISAVILAILMLHAVYLLYKKRDNK